MWRKHKATVSSQLHYILRIILITLVSYCDEKTLHIIWFDYTLALLDSYSISVVRRVLRIRACQEQGQRIGKNEHVSHKESVVILEHSGASQQKRATWTSMAANNASSIDVTGTQCCKVESNAF
jgi:hypothetical protein